MTHKVREFGVGFESPRAREFIALAKRAEETGFGTFWVPEDPFYRGAFTLASAVACGTSTIKVGIGVLNPYTRHPALTAMEFAALDEVSGGRAILGIGAGLKDWIEGRLKIPYTRPTVAMRESIEITRRLFRGENVSLAGRVFQTDRIKLSFKPPRTDIPIHLGVLGPKNLGGLLQVCAIGRKHAGVVWKRSSANGSTRDRISTPMGTRSTGRRRPSFVSCRP